jgi:hypothetical protein
MPSIITTSKPLSRRLLSTTSYSSGRPPFGSVLSSFVVIAAMMLVQLDGMYRRCPRELGIKKRDSFPVLS